MLAFETLWFFLPILAANQGPGLAALLKLPGAHMPISQRWLGSNKTLAPYYVAPLVGLGTVYLQREANGWLTPPLLFDYNRSDLWLIGVLFGSGAVVGDHAKSFVKRRLGLPPGARWWPFDQLDFVIGGILFVTPVIGWIGWDHVLMCLGFMLLLHPVGNYLGYHFGLRKVPW